jgi:hypothetical protein
VRESQVVNDWINEGKAEGRTEALLRVLRARCGAVPDELAAQVRATTDEALLDRWLAAAAVAGSFDEFRHAFRP